MENIMLKRLKQKYPNLNPHEVGLIVAVKVHGKNRAWLKKNATEEAFKRIEKYLK